MMSTLFIREHNAIADALTVGVPAVDRRGALPAGAADHRGAHREDPHRRVDTGHHRPPDHRDGHERELVRASPGSGFTRSSAGSAAARYSAASPARRPTTSASRTRSPRSSSIVYRMHPLIPDDYTFRRAADDAGDCRAYIPRSSPAPLRNELPEALDMARHALQLRHRPPRRARPAQLPALPAAVPAARMATAASTWRPPTSCASASSACRATTSSAGCCTCGPAEQFRRTHRRPATGSRRLRARSTGDVDRVDTDRRHVRRADARPVSASATPPSGSSS